MPVARLAPGAGTASAVIAVIAVLAAVAVVALGSPGCSSGPSCGPRQAVVDRVIDGDTIVAGGLTIRYLLVNAPEVNGGRSDCYGASAARFNADLVLGKTIELDYDAVCQDRFGRALAYVTVAGREVNRLLIARGYACVLHIPPDGDERADEFQAVEAAARSEQRGLWGACDPVPCR
jgi:micrococcal nuclease